MSIMKSEEPIGAMNSSIRNSSHSHPQINHSEHSFESLTSPILGKVLTDSSTTSINPQIQETQTQLSLNYENEGSMEEFSDEWLCLHFHHRNLSHSYLEDGVEDHDENFGQGNQWNKTIDFGNRVTCKLAWDKILCWPETPEGAIATLPCFPNLNGIQYDGNVSRLCEEGGIWQDVTNYSSCVPQTTGSQEADEGLGVTIHVYFFGYCLSLTALLAAMIIFISFKELRCLRNKIHTNLIVTYILAGTLWIITNFTTTAQSMQKGNIVSSRVSCVTFVLLHYFHLTNFFMMFVEGLYLYVLVVKTFVAENIKLQVYAAIGWGIPLLIMIVWSITKWFTQHIPLDTTTGGAGEVDAEFLVPCVIGVAEDVYDWIYKAPVFLCLFANVLFLVRIMWVLITKLRSATSPETQQSRKAAKALIVLMPLLGITYVFILTGPRKLPAFEHIRALLISTQGFLVALLYCFLNGEVRIALRHRWNRLTFCRGGRQNVDGHGGRERKECHCSKVMNYVCCSWCHCCWKKEERQRRRRQIYYVRDLSSNSRSRTESNYFEYTNHPFRKRASSSSEATTMSTLSFSGRTSISAIPCPQSLNPAAAKRLSTLSTSPGHLVLENDTGQLVHNDTVFSI